VVDGRERRDHNPAGAQLRLQLAQRDGGLGIDKGPEQILVRIQNPTTVAADPARRHRPGLAHPPHQLHGRRRADFIANGGLSDRTATLNRPHNPLAKVLGQRCCHGAPPVTPLHRGIRTTDSDQSQTALARFSHAPDEEHSPPLQMGSRLIAV
jgi:hypothetical protein